MLVVVTTMSFRAVNDLLVFNANERLWLDCFGLHSEEAHIEYYTIISTREGRLIEGCKQEQQVELQL